uniref:DNA-directed RNA polymerase subunit beta n=1 Tax=Ephedra trifurca TaxID=39583 RepID=A0A0C4W3E1_9SPER|nr:DNA-directed RNA polymerase IV second largest subunit [Ephedra trifurca]
MDSIQDNAVETGNNSIIYIEDEVEQGGDQNEAMLIDGATQEIQDETMLIDDDFMEDRNVQQGEQSGNSKTGESFVNDYDINELLQEMTVNVDEDISSEQEDGSKLTEKEMHAFSKEASKAFFDEWGLLSHQLNSFNDFISHGLQRLFDSLGDIEIEPDYNPKNKGSDGNWRRGIITLGEVTVEKPSYTDKDGNRVDLKPSEARLRNMTYSSPVYVDAKIKTYLNDSPKVDSKSKASTSFLSKGGKYSNNILDQSKRILIGRIPVMVKSKLCHLYGLGPEQLLKERDCYFDLGGYFIIKGHEKVFIAQEERCNTRIWVQNKPVWMAVYTPSNDRYLRKWDKVIVKLNEDIKAKRKAKDNEPSYTSEKDEIVVSFFFITVPVVLLFYALGISSDLEMVQMIGCSHEDREICEFILSSIYKAESELTDFRSREDVLKYIDDKLKNAKYPSPLSVEEVLDAHLFPLIKGQREKAMLLGYMVNCLLSSYLGRRQVENKDDYRNKRLELAGELLGRQMQVLLRFLRKKILKAIQKDLSGQKDLKSMECYIDSSVITNGLARAFSTGTWPHPTSYAAKCTGVVASMKQVNPLQVLSEMRRLRLWVQYAAKLGDARYPNPSYWGRVCFISTPDGENCGLVKNLAVTSVVSGNSSEKPLIEFLEKNGIMKLDDVSLSDFHSMTKVFVNGELLGICNNPDSVVQKMRNMRRKQCINPLVEIKKDSQQKEIRIFCDAGRLLRPLLVVENQQLCIKQHQLSTFKSCENPFLYLLKNRIIEIIGVEEEEDAQIACGVDILQKASISKGFYPPFTHCELDPSFLLSLNASLIPFANRNLATRTLYQSEKHSRQAIGHYTTSLKVRSDTSGHELLYPQKPLFRTLSYQCLSKPQLYNGQNAIVAVNVHYGYNQEDSLVANRASIDRGMFRSMHYRLFTSEAEYDENQPLNSSRLDLDFGKPSGSNLKIDKLDDDGLPFISSDLYSGDVLIGKVGPQPSDSNFSLKLKHTEKGRVDQVLMTTNDCGKKYAKVRLREMRVPTVGDKFSSMHGQKGVVGFIEEQENMPFTKQGIVPDLIINPHAFPSRQTPGQLFECALGKAIAASGAAGDATPFRPMTVEYLTERLHKCGYQQWGMEKMYNGRTGSPLQMKIFIGPTFYQRLIHMAEDKMKYRNHGPVHPLTRQPVHDRKRHGGVKFGEMERDCMLAHGATSNLLERLFYLSDFSTMHICSKCQMVAPVVLENGVRGPHCNFCKTAKHVVKVNVPYACKLLYQELFAMGICLKFETEQM